MNDSSIAYEQVVGPLEDRMVRIVWRITRNREDAEDALQNALLTIWKRWDRVAGHPTPSALVLKICVDAALDVLRRRIRARRKVGVFNSSDEPIDRAPDAHDGLTAQELSEEILAAIHGLSRRQAVAVMLRVFEELSYEEIAAAMGCTEATARKHVERGRARLRIVLEQYEPNLNSRSIP